MMPFVRLIAAILISLVPLAQFSMAQQAEPVMDYATLLTSFDVRPDGRLQLEDNNEPLTAVFLPKSDEAIAVITKSGSKRPLHVQDFYKVQGDKIFTLLESRGKHKEFKFVEPGDYLLSFQTGGKTITELPFTVINKNNNDEFEPKTIWYAQGPWSDWAYLYFLRRDGGNANIEFRMWGQRQSFVAGRETDIYEVVLKKDGDAIAESRRGHVGTQTWLALQFKMVNPQSKGGNVFTLDQLTARDGKYEFVVRKNKQLHAVYRIQISNGKPVLHPRQSASYQPRHQYIVPRYSNLRAGVSDGADTFWMQRLAGDEADAIADAKSADVPGPNLEQLKHWNWLPTRIDPNREFKLTITDIETRTDTGLDVGEDLAAFGVGHPNGIKYLTAGESEVRNIPDGETYSSTVFGVCGKKIILTKRNQVTVFDTESGKLSRIPVNDISLHNPSNRMMNCDGYLVATVNKATDVTDRNIIKIIDVSGDEPAIIPIKNSSYTYDQVNSISVDAKNGAVAIASSAKKMISVAKVVRLANQMVVDVSEFNGVGDFQITIEDEVITYADKDWKIRQLKLGESPQAISEMPIARTGNGFWIRNGRLVAASKKEKIGSRYPMLVTDSTTAPRPIPGTGTDIPGTSAKIGLAGSAAIANDKTVFIAGTPHDSIGVGERLQMLIGDKWHPIIGNDGKPVWGSQVKTSTGFMALKVRNESGKTVIGYATYGQRIVPPANSARAPSTSTDLAIGAELVFADDNPYSTNDENLAATLSGYLETEKSIGESYRQAFGEENGRKKTVETIIDAMKNNDEHDLIDDFLELSIYAEDSDRPEKNTASTTNNPVDENAVTTFLDGHWQAIRFSTEGADLPDNELESLQLMFSNGRYVLNMGSELQTGRYAIDTSTSPLTMTVNIENGNQKGQSRHVSFKPLKHNRLLMVFATNESDTPRKFVPDMSGNSILAVYEKK